MRIFKRASEDKPALDYVQDIVELGDVRPGSRQGSSSDPSDAVPRLLHRLLQVEGEVLARPGQSLSAVNVETTEVDVVLGDHLYLRLFTRNIDHTDVVCRYGVDLELVVISLELAVHKGAGGHATIVGVAIATPQFLK